MARDVSLSQAIDGFLLHKAAEGRSPHTLSDYRVSLRKLLTYCGDIPLRGLTLAVLRTFFAYLDSDYTTIPDGIAPRPEQKLSPKTVRNIHTAISSFFTWAVDEDLARANPMLRIKRKKPDPPPIEPYTEKDLRALLEATSNTRAWHNRPNITSERHTALRDRAMILVLVDTGLRVSELCRLTLADVDRITGHIEVIQGKGQKSRTVRASRNTIRAIWRYLATRPEDLPDDAPLFASTIDSERETEEFLSRYAVLRLLKRLGERTGIRNVNVHRFRHTFAIEYLRNRGDIYTLQLMLGHSSLDMVRRYLRIVQADIDTQHRSASPVTNWRL